ncbi:MAG: hypothetical protein RIS54_1521 [Verrucomicrobiota bacterium]|jgi:PAS domain S-box-containing protein
MDPASNSNSNPPFAAGGTERLMLRFTRSREGVKFSAVCGDPSPFAPLLDAGWPLALLARSIPEHSGKVGCHWIFGGNGTSEGDAVVTLPPDLGFVGTLRVSVFNANQDEAYLTIRFFSLTIFEVLQSPLGEGLRKVVSSSGQAFFVVRRSDWWPVFVGDFMKRLTGLSLAELRADPNLWWKGVVPEDMARVQDMMQAADREGFWSGLIRRRDGSGVVRQLEMHVARLAANQLGAPEALVGVIGDATEISKLKDEVSLLHRGLAEQRKERVDQLVHGIERSKEGFALTDPEGRFTYMNAEHLRIFGFRDLSEVIGQPWTILYNAEQIEFISREAFPKLASNGFWTGHTQAKRMDGSLFSEDLTLSMLPDGSITCNCRDRTQEVAQAALVAQSEQLFREFVEHMPVAVVIRDADNIYRYINGAAKRLIPGLLSDAIGRSADEVLSPGMLAAMHERDEAALAAGGAAVSEIEVDTDEGTKASIELTRFAISDPQGGFSRICTIGTDVTVSRKHQRETSQLVEQQRTLLAMQREFISLVSHEFRTPLAAMQGAHHLLNQRFVELAVDDAKAGRYLELQKASIETLRELVSQVLQLNRIDFMSSEAKLQLESPAAVAELVVRQFNDAMPNPRVTLAIAGVEECKVPLNNGLYRAALENLISNAIKYSPAESKVRVGLRRESGRLCTTVTDNGRGIPEAEQKRLFTNFFRASNVGTIPGTGLGLAIVKRAVDAHGGQVTFATRPNAGSMFQIAIPLESVGPQGEINHV